MAAKAWLLFVVGVLVRCSVFVSSFSDVIRRSVEVSTPLNSWRRVKEGVFLYENGIDPYSGDTFHETPIGLVVFQFLIRSLKLLTPFVFILTDILTAVCLARVAQHFSKELLSKQKTNGTINTYAKDSSSILLTAKDLHPMVNYVAWMYLFNPYTILNCLAMTTTVFTNFFLAACLYFTIKGQRVGATGFLALATYQAFYPIMLLVPVSIYIVEKKSKQEVNNYLNWHVWKSIICTVCSFLIWCTALLMISYAIMKDWSFLSAIYGFVLFVPDTFPNIGLFWYFFTEMFDHFRLFFICTFQINAFIYVFPLAIRIKDNPLLLYFLLCCLGTIFKSYPSIGDVGFYMALLPLFSHLSRHMRQTFLISCIFLACTVLFPITRYLWLFAGSANSNFYFSITLAFATGQIFLATDILFAYLKREFHLYNGVKILDKTGKPAKLFLN